MAKKSETADKTETKDETQNNAGDTLSPDIKDSAVATTAQETGATDGALMGEAVKCVALLITLRASHPHDSYGRCGYRFNKETPVRIHIADIPSEAIGVFDNDPYLDCEYECE